MELGKFVDEELYPAIFEELDKVFPSMKFERYGNKWRSPLNIDGTSPKNKRRDKTIVAETRYQVATENGGGGSKNLISLYMEQNNIGDRIEAIKAISEIVGIAHMIPEGEGSQKWEEERKRREQLALSLDRQRRALFDESNPEAKAVLDYLTEKRGYSIEFIKEIGVGYLSPDEAKFLLENCNIKTNWNVSHFPLSIPYFYKGNVIGFKCRYITAEAKEKYGNQKYRNALLEWVEMNKAPFGMIPSNLSHLNKKEQVIVMEGELDALHATALGLSNVIATSGNKIVPEQAEAIRKNGYKNVVILLDADEAGQQFTGESIKCIDEAGLNSFTATIPDAKDADEYLKSHTIGELKEIIDKAVFGGLWLYKKEVEKFYQSPQTETEFFKFIDSFIGIASKYREPYKREILYTYLRNDFQDNIEAIEKGIRESTEKRVKEAEDGDETKAALDTLKEASASIIEGKKEKGKLEELDTFQDALNIIGKGEEKLNAINTLRSLSPSVISRAGKGETLEDIGKLKKAVRTLQKSEQEEGFSSMLKDNTDELYSSYKDTPEALHTKFELYHKEGSYEVPYKLSFPSGVLSIIGAQTNHGKSKILQTLALDAIESMEEEGQTILYITYEENELNVNAQFENAYFNDTLTRESAKGSNLQTIIEWLTKGETRYMRNETRDKFFQAEEEWKAIRRSGKIKILKPEENYLETLIALIEFAVKHFKIKAIFLDYIQEVYVENWSQYSRTDELKQAMVQLDAIAQKTKLPIILAAQLSREAISPLDLRNQYIADSGWIERKASEILLVWSNSEDVGGKSLKEVEDKRKRVNEEIPELYKDGRNGKLYFKLTKSRIIPKGSYAIVSINGNTGRVSQQLKEAPKPKPIQTTFISSSSTGSSSTTYDNNVKSDVEAQKPQRGGNKNEEEELPF